MPVLPVDPDAQQPVPNYLGTPDFTTQPDPSMYQAPAMPDFTVPLHHRDLNPQVEQGLQQQGQMQMAQQVGQFQQAQAQNQQAQRIKGEDLMLKGNAVATDANGNVGAINDETGAPLTNYNPRTGIGYDSQGQARQVKSNGLNAPPSLKDPFADVAPEVDTQTGDIVQRRNGLPTRVIGSDDNIKQQIQQRLEDRLNAQSAELIGGQNSAYHTAYNKELAASKMTADQLFRQNVLPPVDSNGDPITRQSLQNVDPDELKQMINDNFAQQLKSPEANEKGFFGGALTPAAQSYRDDIAQKQQAALALADQHIGHLTKMGAIQNQVDQITSTRDQLSGDRVDYVNRQRQAMGLPALPAYVDPSQLGQSGVPGADTASGGATGVQTPGTGAPLYSKNQDGTIDLQPGQHRAGLLAAEHDGAIQTTPDMLNQADTADKQSAGIAAAANGQRAYQFDPQNGVQFQPGQLLKGIRQANQDGLVDDDKAKQLSSQAADVDQAYRAQEDAVNKAGGWSRVKALLHGAGRGAAFLAAAPVGAGLGAEAGEPLAPFTGGLSVPVLSAAGALISGALGTKAYNGLLNTVGKYSDTVNSFNASSQLHPNYDAAGNLISFAAGLPKAGMELAGKGIQSLAGDSETLGSIADAYKASGGGLGSTISNLAEDASIRAKQGVSTAGIARAIATKVGGVALGNVAVDTIINEGAKALGLQQQGETVPGAVQAALVGAFVSGHGISFEGWEPHEVADVLTRGAIRESAGLKPTEAMTVQQIAQQYPNADSTQTAALAKPLTSQEAEIYNQASAKIKQRINSGEPISDDAKFTAKQALLNGKPYGVSSVEIQPAESGGPSDTSDQSQPPSRLALPPTGEQASASSSGLEPNPASPVPRQPPVEASPSDALSQSGTNSQPSSLEQPTEQAAAGQAQTAPQEDLLTEKNRIEQELQEPPQSQLAEQYQAAQRQRLAVVNEGLAQSLPASRMPAMETEPVVARPDTIQSKGEPISVPAGHGAQGEPATGTSAQSPLETTAGTVLSTPRSVQDFQQRAFEHVLDNLPTDRAQHVRDTMQKHNAGQPLTEGEQKTLAVIKAHVDKATRAVQGGAVAPFHGPELAHKLGIRYSGPQGNTHQMYSVPIGGGNETSLTVPNKTTPTELGEKVFKKQQEFKPEQQITFKTEKGSVYNVHEDGTTSRNKAARKEHGNDQGDKPKSSRTIYVSPDTAQDVLDHVNSMHEEGDGTIVVNTAGQPVYGVYKSGPKKTDPKQWVSTKPIPIASETPKIGLQPLEIWNSPDGKSANNFHLGNKITEINQPKEGGDTNYGKQNIEPTTNRAPGDQRPANEITPHAAVAGKPTADIARNPTGNDEGRSAEGGAGAESQPAVSDLHAGEPAGPGRGDGATGGLETPSETENAGGSSKEPVAAGRSEGGGELHGESGKQLDDVLEERKDDLEKAGITVDRSGRFNQPIGYLNGVLHINPEEMARASAVVERKGGDGKAWENAAVSEEIEHHKDEQEMLEAGKNPEEEYLKIYKGLSRANQKLLIDAYLNGKTEKTYKDGNVVKTADKDTLRIMLGREWNRMLRMNKNGEALPESYHKPAKLVSALNKALDEANNPPAVKDPLETLNTADKVKIVPPKGASMIRVTDAKGRKHIEPISAANKGGNIFKGADIKKIEVGTMTSKGFLPMKGETDIQPAFAQSPDDQDPLGFYSKLSRTIADKMPNRASADQVRGLVNSAGVKKDEVLWSGLDDYLKDAKEPLDKNAVMDFVKNNGVKVTEKVLGNNSPMPQELQKHFDSRDSIMNRMPVSSAEWGEASKKFERVAQNYQRKGDAETSNKYFKMSDQATALSEGLNSETGSTMGEPKFSQYQLPGADAGTYREVLLTTPTKSHSLEQWKVIRKDGHVDGTFADSKAASNRAEQIGGIVKQGDTLTNLTGGKDNFHSSHFDESNILAHARINERSTTDGNNVLHAEEIQSDWHQKGRKEGYRQEKIINREAAAEKTDGKFGPYSVIDGSGNYIWVKLKTLEEAEAKATQERQKTQTIVKNDGPPDAPFKTTWPALVLKRLIRIATEKGKDGITWTDGATQSDRYDLSKQLNGVSITRDNDGEYAISAWDKNDNNVLKKSGLTTSEVEQHIGKELATKAQIQPTNESVKYDGLDLKVGGSGMKGFYDQILPSVANDIGKKFGAKAETKQVDIGKRDFHNEQYTIQASNSGKSYTVRKLLPPTEKTSRGVGDAVAGPFKTNQEAQDWMDVNTPKNTTPVHYLPITDAMRKSVMEDGQPMFASSPQAQDDEPDENRVTLPNGKTGEIARHNGTDAMRESVMSEGQPLFVQSPDPFTKFYKAEIEPSMKEVGTNIQGIAEGAKHLFAPAAGVPRESLDEVMKMKGDRDKAEYILEKQLAGWQKGFDKMSQPEQIDFIDKIKTGQKQPSPELQTVADTLRDIDTKTWQKAVNEGIPLAWLDNHYRVMWKVIPGTKELKSDIPPGGGRGPLRGSRGMAKQHTLDDMSSGIAAGGVPYSYNPMTMFKMAQADLNKFITAQKMWNWVKESKNATFVKSGGKLPEGHSWISDNIAKAYFKTPEGVVGEGGKWAVESNLARILNNYLSQDFVRQSALGKSLLWVKNAITAAELSLSPFHAVFESLETAASTIGLGLHKIANRGILGGNTQAVFEGLKDIASAPASPVTNAKLGGKIIKYITQEGFENTPEGKEFLKQYPDAKQMVDDLFHGGAKLASQQDWKNNSAKAFMESINKNDYIGATLRAVPGLNEMLMKPLFDHYIPRLKMATFFREYSEALKQNEDKLAAGKITRPTLARQHWKFVEDRFGEMNFDNLFWNRTFKTAMQLMFRSVTWKMGSVSAIGGGMAGQAREFVNAFKERRAPELHRNMAWLMGVSLLTAAMATIMQKALAHKNPGSITDLVYPQIDPHDNKMRVGLPTYLKDVVHIAHSPTGYITSSLAGWIGRLIELWNNQDFYGTRIRDENASIINQVGQVGGHLAGSLLPFSIKGYKNLSENQVGTLRKSLAFLGMNPAPRYISQSPAEKLAESYAAAHRPIGGQSPEQFESSVQKHQLVEQIQHGQTPNFSKAISTGVIKPGDVKQIYARAGMTPLQYQVQHMPLADAQKIYAISNPAEKAQLAAIIARKRSYQGTYLAASK